MAQIFCRRKHGGLAKRLCSGLQIRLERFDSATRLQLDQRPTSESRKFNLVGGYTGVTLHVARSLSWQLHALIREEFLLVMIIDSEAMRFVLSSDAHAHEDHPLVNGVTKRYCKWLQRWQNGA